MTTPNDAQGGATPPAAENTPPAAAHNDNPLLRSLFSLVEDKPKEAKPEKKSSGSSLHEFLAESDAATAGNADGKKAEEPEKKPDTAPKEEAKADGGEPPPAAPKRVKVRRAKEEAPPAPVVPAAPPAAAPAKAPERPADSDEGLLDEEKDKLRIARYAAKANPKYAGHAEKLATFFRKNAEFTTKKLAEDPEYDFSESNPEYKAFLNANRPPPIPDHEQKAIEREMIKDEIRAETEQKLEAERTAQRNIELRKQHRVEANQFWKETVTIAMPDEIRAAWKEGGAAKAKELHPFEYNLLEGVSKSAADIIENFMAISSGAMQFDPKNEQHTGIAEFINTECSDFAKNGGDDRVRDGKQFVSRTQFQRLPAEQRAGYWTFSNKELVDRAKFAVKLAIKQAIDGEYKRREEQGWVRKAATPAAAPAKQQPVPTPASAPRPAPASGGAGTPAAKPVQGDGNPVMKALGLTG